MTGQSKPGTTARFVRLEGNAKTWTKTCGQSSYRRRTVTLGPALSIVIQSRSDRSRGWLWMETRPPTSGSPLLVVNFHSHQFSRFSTLADEMRLGEKLCAHHPPPLLRNVCHRLSVRPFVSFRFLCPFRGSPLSVHIVSFIVTFYLRPHVKSCWTGFFLFCSYYFWPSALFALDEIFNLKMNGPSPKPSHGRSSSSHPIAAGAGKANIQGQRPLCGEAHCVC